MVSKDRASAKCCASASPRSDGAEFTLSSLQSAHGLIQRGMLPDAVSAAAARIVAGPPTA